MIIDTYSTVEVAVVDSDGEITTGVITACSAGQNCNDEMSFSMGDTVTVQVQDEAEIVTVIGKIVEFL